MTTYKSSDPYRGAAYKAENLVAYKAGQLVAEMGENGANYCL